jgi:hypothetical protein
MYNQSDPAVSAIPPIVVAATPTQRQLMIMNCLLKRSGFFRRWGRQCLELWKAYGCFVADLSLEIGPDRHVKIAASPVPGIARVTQNHRQKVTLLAESIRTLWRGLAASTS